MAEQSRLICEITQDSRSSRFVASDEYTFVFAASIPHRWLSSGNSNL